MIRSPRAWAWRSLAVVVALITAVVVSSDLRALHAHAHDLGAPRQVVVARHDLVLGHHVAAADLDVVTRYSTQVAAGALRSARDAVGRTVTLSVAAGAPVLGHNLAATAGGYGVVLTTDTRVVRVPDVQGLDPAVGAVVDVVATYRSDQPSGGLATIVAPGGVVVEADRSPAAARSDSAAAAAERGTDLAVALLVRRSDALRIASALANGQVVLALAPPEEACCSPH